MSQLEYSAKFRGVKSSDFYIKKLKSNQSFICCKTNDKTHYSYEIRGPVKSDNELTLGEINKNTAQRAEKIQIHDQKLVNSTSYKIYTAQEAENCVLSKMMKAEVLKNQSDCLISVSFTVDKSSDPEVNACIEQYCQLRLISLATAMGMIVEDIERLELT